MTEQVYKDLLEVMKSRRGGVAGMDIPEFFALRAKPALNAAHR